MNATFQASIEEDGVDLLELGLLMTEEPGVMEEDDEELYSFQHKLLHEYTAAIYVSKQIEENPHFLSQHFPTHADIYNYREVIAFCVHILRSQNASLPLKHVICYVCDTFSGFVYEKLTNGMFETEFSFKHQFETMFKVILEAMASSKLTKASHIFSPNAYKYKRKIGKYNAEMIPRVKGRSGLTPAFSPANLHSQVVVSNQTPLGYTMSETKHMAVTSSYHTLHMVTSHQSHATKRMISLIEHEFYPWEISKSTNKENCLLIPAGQKLPEHVLDRTSFICCKISDKHSVDLSNYINQCNTLLGTLNIDNPVLSNHGKRPVETLFNALSRYGCLESLIVRGIDSSEEDSNSLHLLTEHLHTSLVKLGLSSCRLTRANIKALAAGIEAGRFPNLQQVDLSISDISKSLPKSLHLIHLLPGLEELDLGMKDISNSLHLLTEHLHASLVSLNVNSCKLTRADIKALAAGIEAERFPKLKAVDASFNDLGKSLHLLTVHLHTSLVKLDISYCKLTRADIKALTAGIEAGRFPQLKEVDVKGNDLSKSLHLVHLLPGLKMLDVSRKDISNSLHLLAKRALTSLIKLNISNCNLTRADVKALAAGIEAKRFPRLKEVDVRGNDLSNSLHLVHLLPGLEKLDVSRKYISNSLHLLTKHVQTTLIKLDVHKCNLTKTDIEALTAGIEAGRFPQLRKVDVRGNDLSKSLHLVHLLPGLEELDVSRKDIGNSLHLLIQNVQTSLIRLNVSNWNLTRADMEALVAGIEAGRFPNLQQVNLSMSDIIKLLPYSLHLVHLLPGLKELDVSREDISNSLHLLTEHVQHSLVKLNIGKRNLTRAVMGVLSTAIMEGKFPKLKQIGIDINSKHQSIKPFQLLPGQTELYLSRKDISNALHLFLELVQTSLVKLNASRCNLTRADIEALAAGIEAGRFPHLKKVDVRGYDLSKSLHLVHLLPGLEELDVNGKDISNSLHLLTEHLHTSLVKLDFHWCNLTRADIEALAAGIEAGRFPQLKQVDVSGNDLSNSLHLLTKHVHTSLVKLDIRLCALTRADIEALAVGIEAGRFPQLKEVDLGFNDLGKALHLLTDHSHASLVKLHIENCNLTRADIEALAAGIEVGRFPQLKEVDVRGNDLSNSLHLLTENVQATVCSLYVEKCNLTGSDVSALAAALTAGRLPCLQDIDLGGNNLRNSLHLLTEHVQATLCSLYVEKCNLTGSDVSALAAALTAGRLPCLQDIDLGGNNLRNSLHLLTEHVQATLCSLYVEKCNLTGSDVSALAAALTAGRLPCLQDIDLGYNALDDDAVQPLCKALLQYDGPDQTAQSIWWDGTVHLGVWLWDNKISAQFIEQWKEKLKHNHNVRVYWTYA